MGLTAAGMVARPIAAFAAIDPDLVVYNAKVYTIDSASPRAEAFAVAASRFVAIGSSADIRALAGKRTRTFDAKGMTISLASSIRTITPAARRSSTKCSLAIPSRSSSSPSRASSTN
jgi:hypothetical protein